MQPSTTNWIDNAAKNAPVAFVRDCATTLQQTGYLSLGAFFEHVSDMELGSILHLFYESGNSTDPKIVQDANTGIGYILAILRAGAGIYTTDAAQLNQHVVHFAHYVVHEINDRKFLSDRQLSAKRMKYSIEVKPEERK